MVPRLQASLRKACMLQHANRREHGVTPAEDRVRTLLCLAKSLSMQNNLREAATTYVDCHRFRTRIATGYPYHQAEAP